MKSHLEIKKELLGDTDNKFVQMQVVWSAGLDVGGGDFKINFNKSTTNGKFGGIRSF